MRFRRLIEVVLTGLQAAVYSRQAQGRFYFVAPKSFCRIAAIVDGAPRSVQILSPRLNFKSQIPSLFAKAIGDGFYADRDPPNPSPVGIAMGPQLLLAPSGIRVAHMWRTPAGTRVLRDIEALVARRGLETAVELIELGLEADEPWEFGIRQFDALAPSQQLALLADVGKALFYKHVRPPVHTAINEACVYTIFRALEISVQFEIDGEVRWETPTRQLICDFIAAEEDEKDEELLDDEDGIQMTPDCDEIDNWQFEIECIADRILWDRDWELDDLMVDSGPQEADFLKQHLGIEGDYFTAIAPDPMDLSRVRQTLRRILRAKPR